MKVLITGANGFIGQSLMMRLMADGHHVVGAVRGQPSHTNHIQVGDISDQPAWNSLLRNCDVVIHTAARAHILQENSSNPVEIYRRINTFSTLGLAHQSVISGVKRFVFVSSAGVNGFCSRGMRAFKETDIPAPHNEYAISKFEAESELLELACRANLEVVIVRPPIVYGPRVKANFLNLLKIVDKAIPLPLGAIENSRSMIYLGNLVDALATCATHPAAAGQIYLVSDGEDISTSRLIEAIAAALGRPNRNIRVPVNLIRFIAKLLGKSVAIDRLTQSLIIDSSKIRNELSWSPPYTLTQGLQATADWYLASKLEQSS